MAPGDLRVGVDDVVGEARADREERARAVARTDEDVLGPRRRVDEVPGLQRPLLAFDDQQALALQDEEVLLLVLAVVVARGLARLEHADVEADVGEAALAFKARVGAEVAGLPERVTRVEHEPAGADRDEPPFLLLEPCLLAHAPEYRRPQKCAVRAGG